MNDPLPEPVTTPARPGAPGPVAEDLPCNQCGYNLRSLAEDGDCPECGLAVKHSIGLGALKRWPLNAEQPLGWMSLGLFTMWLMGLGVPMWVGGLAVLLWRMPETSPLWTGVRHAAWVSLALIVGGVVSLMTVPQASGSTTRTLLIVVVLGSLAHFVCVFMLAFRITLDARMPAAQFFAVAMLVAQFVLVGVALLLGIDEEETFVVMIASALFWWIIGGLFWMGVAGELGARRHDLTDKINKVSARDRTTKRV